MVGFDHLHLHYNQQETTGRQLFLPLGPTYGMVEWSINRAAIHVYLAMCVYWRARLLHGNVYQLIDRFAFLKKVMSYGDFEIQSMSLYVYKHHSGMQELSVK